MNKLTIFWYLPQWRIVAKSSRRSQLSEESSDGEFINSERMISIVSRNYRLLSVPVMQFHRVNLQINGHMTFLSSLFTPRPNYTRDIPSEESIHFRNTVSSSAIMWEPGNTFQPFFWTGRAYHTTVTKSSNVSGKMRRSRVIKRAYGRRWYMHVTIFRQEEVNDGKQNVAIFARRPLLLWRGVMITVSLAIPLQVVLVTNIAYFW